MAAYFLVNVDVTNSDGYEEYCRMAGATIGKYGGKFLVRGGAAEALEGTTVPKRVVLLQFDTPQKAREWYTSPEYTEAIKVRQANSVTEMFILAEGN